MVRLLLLVGAELFYGRGIALKFRRRLRLFGLVGGKGCGRPLVPLLAAEIGGRLDS